MSLEKTWYEASPYVYGVMGIVSLFVAESKIAYLSAALLISSAITIISLRRHYRAAERDSVR
ncbi:MAG: hypothetical protein V4488_08290 [Pseudomonadota bacterium]